MTLKKRPEYEEEVFKVNDDALMGGGGTRKKRAILDSLILYRRKFGMRGGESDDIRVLLAKLTNERMETVLAEIDEFVKRIVRIHIVGINNELLQWKKK